MYRRFFVRETVTYNCSFIKELFNQEFFDDVFHVEFIKEELFYKEDKNYILFIIIAVISFYLLTPSHKVQLGGMCSFVHIMDEPFLRIERNGAACLICLRIAIM